VVTGGSKGIGLEVCKQLAASGITVVLTARDETRGTAAVEQIKQLGHSDVIFHQLDITDASSIDRLSDFLNSRFGKLDILVCFSSFEQSICRYLLVPRRIALESRYPTFSSQIIYRGVLQYDFCIEISAHSDSQVNNAATDGIEHVIDPVYGVMPGGETVDFNM
jgi:hypothetical protein